MCDVKAIDDRRSPYTDLSCEASERSNVDRRVRELLLFRLPGFVDNLFRCVIESECDVFRNRLLLARLLDQRINFLFCQNGHYLTSSRGESIVQSSMRPRVLSEFPHSV